MPRLPYSVSPLSSRSSKTVPTGRPSPSPSLKTRKLSAASAAPMADRARPGGCRRRTSPPGIAVPSPDPAEPLEQQSWHQQPAATQCHARQSSSRPAFVGDVRRTAPGAARAPRPPGSPPATRNGNIRGPSPRWWGHPINEVSIPMNRPRPRTTPPSTASPTRKPRARGHRLDLLPAWRLSGRARRPPAPQRRACRPARRLAANATFTASGA